MRFVKSGYFFRVVSYRKIFMTRRYCLSEPDLLNGELRRCEAPPHTLGMWASIAHHGAREAEHPATNREDIKVIRAVSIVLALRAKT